VPAPTDPAFQGLAREAVRTAEEASAVKGLDYPTSMAAWEVGRTYLVVIEAETGVSRGFAH
jgi:hypothetical protein